MMNTIEVPVGVLSNSASLSCGSWAAKMQFKYYHVGEFTKTLQHDLLPCHCRALMTQGLPLLCHKWSTTVVKMDSLSQWSDQSRDQLSVASVTDQSATHSSCTVVMC